MGWFKKEGPKRHKIEMPIPEADEAFIAKEEEAARKLEEDLSKEGSGPAPTEEPEEMDPRFNDPTARISEAEQMKEAFRSMRQ